MMAQQQIEKYGTFTEPLLHSEGECKFHIENGLWIGTCQHYTRHKTIPKQPCRHVQAHLLHELRQTQKWLDFKSQWKSKAEFECFEDAMEALTIYKAEELSFISRLILTIAYARGSVNGDDVYNVWESGPSKPQVMSAAWSGLIKKDLIVRVGTHQSERSVNRSEHGVYRLTEASEEMMLNIRGKL